MSAFYFFSDEQLRKLKIDDLLKLANYYHVAYTKGKPNVERIIGDILNAQKTQSFMYSGASEQEPTGMSAKIRRIYEQNRKE